MTASSQNPPGAQPPEVQHDPAPLRAAVVSYAAVTPAPAGPVSPAQAATGVITAAMEQGHTSPAEIAEAEEAAGILFAPQRAEEIAAAAREQAKAELAVELAQAVQDREAREWYRLRQRAVGQLCEGRPLDYYVAVGEVLAALDGRTPTTAPLTITWNGLVMGPSGDSPQENTLVPCTTARGGSAVLVLDDEQRMHLGDLLLAVLQPAEACTTQGCGKSEAELDAYGAEPHLDLWGWTLIHVHGVEGPARWWCNPWCAAAAMAASRAELAAADQDAATDPAQQSPGLPVPDAGAPRPLGVRGE